MDVADKENVVNSGFVTISPPPKAAPKRAAQPSGPEDATLVLRQFAEVPWLKFGSVVPRATATAQLHLSNPGAAAAQLTLDKVPSGKGFHVEGATDGAITVQPGQTETLTVRWTPSSEGNCRETLLLRWQGKNRLQVVLYGTGSAAAGRVNNKGKGKSKKGKGGLAKEARKPAPSTGQDETAQSHISKAKHAAPRRPLTLKSGGPSLRPPQAKIPVRSGANKARKKTRSDDQWMDKQERCFAKWLTHLLDPDNSEQVDAPGDGHTAKGMQLHEIDNQLQQFRLRDRAFQLITAPETRECLVKLKSELEAGRVAAIRADASLHADVSVHNNCLQCVMSYNTAWLRLGLEAVYAESLPCGDNDEKFLSAFVKQRLLFDKDMAEAFKHDAQQASLNKFTTMMMLSLVLFLDRAKAARLLDNDPSLFKREGKIKSSSDMIHSFFDGVLSGGGDIVRQLRHIDYKLEHAQTPLAEYPFAVSNLNNDLKDGVRLCKLAEVLTNSSGPMSDVKCPAKSPAVMKFNINLALDAFQKRGCNVKLCAKAEDIMKGHHERTLSLLWNVMMHWQVMDMIDVQALSDEVDRIRYWRRDSVSDGRRSSVASNSGIVDTQIYMNSDKLRLLLLWCRGVCARHGVRVHNFTSSFSDGRVLCLLIHHYHPEILSLDEISGRPKKEQVNPADFDDDNCETMAGGEKWVNYFIPIDSVDDDDDADVANEAKMKNFHLLQSTVMKLGGIPNIITPRDMVSTAPDEKVVITYVTYLSSRLLDIRVQVEAARKIRQHWKTYAAQVVLPRKTAAARIIQQSARARFDFSPIERQNQKIKAAQLIQRMWRGMTTREQVLPMMRAQLVSVDLLQATFRAFLQRRVFKRVLNAVCTIQSRFHSTTARNLFVTKRQAAIEVQRQTRGRQARVHAEALLQQQKQAADDLQQADSATQIQARFRCWTQNARYLRTRSAAVALQSAWKGYVGRRSFKAVKAMVHFQAMWRGAMARQQLQRQAAAATCIQAAFRAHCELGAHRVLRSAVVAAQAAARCARARQAYVAQREAAVRVQAALRGREARKAFCTIKSMVKVQALWRGVHVRQQMQKFVAAASRIQSAVRTHSHKHQYRNLLRAVSKIQSAARCRRANRAYESMRESCIVIQSHARSQQARKMFADMTLRRAAEHCAASTTIQAAHRSRTAYRSYQQLRTAAVTVQAAVRSRSMARLTRDAATAQIQASVRIQRAFRGAVGRRAAAGRLHSIVQLQSAVRGNCVRQSTDADTAAIRLRLRETQTNATDSDKLGNRTDEALDVLKTSSQLAVIIEACVTLDTATHWSRVCCQRVVEEDAEHIVLRLIRSCNRSTPHMQLLNSAMNVIQNLCKHRGTCKAVFAVAESVDILVELMQMYRDKHSIFIQACSILRKMCKIDSQRKAVIAMTDITKRIDGIGQLLELKYKREQDHCARMQESSKTRSSGAVKHLRAQLGHLKQLMKHLGDQDDDCQRRLHL